MPAVGKVLQVALYEKLAKMFLNVAELLCRT